MTLLAQNDNQSDDIYLFDVSESLNTRVSTSSFGTPALICRMMGFQYRAPQVTGFHP